MINNLIVSLMASPTQDFYLSIGQLVQITTNQTVRLDSPEQLRDQMPSIIEWVNTIKSDLQTEHTLRLELESELDRLRSEPALGQILTTIDLAIQDQMKQLRVDINLGSQLLPRIMEVVDAQMTILVQQIASIKAHADKLSQQLIQTHSLAQIAEEGTGQEPPLISMVQSQTVNTSQILPPTGIQIQSLIERIEVSQKQVNKLGLTVLELEKDNQRLRQTIDVIGKKNSELVEQLSYSNLVIETLQSKFEAQELRFSAQASTGQTNDANIKIISELKNQKEDLNSKISELVQQTIDANARAEEAQRKLKNKSAVATPVRDNNETKTSSSHPRFKELEEQLRSRQQEILSLRSNERNADTRINELITQLLAANAEVMLFRNVETPNNLQPENDNIQQGDHRIQQLTERLSISNLRIAELQQMHPIQNSRREESQYRQETRNIEMGTQLAHAYQRIEELNNQLAIACNRVTDLELDIETINRQNDDRLGNVSEQKRLDMASHELLMANNKVEDMMRMVANYQNNSIDLELDKEALVFQLNDARNKQQDYFDQLKVERASVDALKQEIIRMKEHFYNAARNHVVNISQQIGQKESVRSIHRPVYSVEIHNTDAVQEFHPNVEKSERSYRESGHKKIFTQGAKVRGSHISGSSRKEVMAQEV